MAAAMVAGTTAGKARAPRCQKSLARFHLFCIIETSTYSILFEHEAYPLTVS